MSKKQVKVEPLKAPPVYRYRALQVVRLSGGLEVEMMERLAAKRRRRVSRIKKLAQGAEPADKDRDWFKTNEPIDVKVGEVFALRSEIDKGQQSRVEPEK